MIAPRYGHFTHDSSQSFILDMARPGERSQSFAAGPRQTSTSMPQPPAPSDFGHGDPRHPRIDTLQQASQASNNLHSQLTAIDSASPNSTDFNFPFGGSPHTSISSGFEAPMDNRMNVGMNGRNSMPGMVTVPGTLPLSTQHRGSFNRVTPYGAGLSSNYLPADHWSPSNNQGMSHAGNGSDENLTKVESNGSVHRRESEHQNDGEDGERPPPWSELKTKAGRERKRLPLACIACRRKKIKCSGEKPACKHCLRARIPCVYKVTARKAAPRTDYMAMLDKRLKRMEERVIKVIPKEDLPDVASSGRSSVRPPVPGQTPKPARPSFHKKRSADEAFVIELQEWTRARNQSALNTAPGANEIQKDGENKLYVEGLESLPPIHIQEHLAEVFFDCIYGQSYLLLHKPSFMRKLKAGTVPPVLVLAVCAIAARFSTHPQVGGDPAFLRGNPWATAARSIVEKRHYEPNMTILTVMLILGLHYFGTCEGGLSWSFGGQAMRMAYALQLHRELDHDPLGKNKSANKPSELSFTDREIRRRTMWACFLMDTFNSSGTERPSFGNEDYMHIQLPIKESHFQMEVPGPTEDLDGDVPNPISPGMGQISDPKENMGVAAYVIRAVVLWKRIVKYLNLGGKEKDPHPLWDPLSQFTHLRRQIIRAKESLPASLRYNETNLANHAAERVANQFLYLHIVHAQNSLFLHRFAIPTSPSARPPKDMPKQFLSDAARDVVESAAQISQLIEEASAHMLTVPFAGYCAYASSTVHVWGIFSKNEHLEASSKENLRHNYKYLNRMKRYWGMFHYMAESVKEIYRHFADAAIRSQQQGGPGHRHQLSSSSTGDSSTASNPGSPMNADAGGGGAEMFQYGNWFDKYPLGVSETEWEDEHRGYKKEAGQGAEAVMSQRSDLQSVEEFFASLSPPSKAELQAAQARKVARRGKGRGATVAEAKKVQAQGQGQGNVVRVSTPDSATGSGVAMSGNNWPDGLSTAMQQQQQHNQLQQQQLQHQGQQQQQAHGMNTDYMDTSQAQLYQQQAAHAHVYAQQQHAMDYHPHHPGHAGTGLFNFSNALPQLDRQLVFGAYAGIDATTSGHGGLNNMGLWEGMDLSAVQHGQVSGPGQAYLDHHPSSSAAGGSGSHSGSAWFMPFNMDPPNFGDWDVVGADMSGDMSGMGLGPGPGQSQGERVPSTTSTSGSGGFGGLSPDEQRRGGQGGQAG